MFSQVEKICTGKPLHYSSLFYFLFVELREVKGVAKPKGVSQTHRNPFRYSIRELPRARFHPPETERTAVLRRDAGNER